MITIFRKFCTAPDCHVMFVWGQKHLGKTYIAQGPNHDLTSPGINTTPCKANCPFGIEGRWMISWEDLEGSAGKILDKMDCGLTSESLQNLFQSLDIEPKYWAHCYSKRVNPSHESTHLGYRLDYVQFSALISTLVLHPVLLFSCQKALLNVPSIKCAVHTKFTEWNGMKKELPASMSRQEYYEHNCY